MINPLASLATKKQLIFAVRIGNHLIFFKFQMAVGAGNFGQLFDLVIIYWKF